MQNIKKEKQVDDMLRGISRGVVEVEQLDSPYFERAVLYIRPDIDEEQIRTLRQKGETCLKAITQDFSPVSQAVPKKRKGPGWALPFFSALGGSAVTWLLMSAGSLI